MGDSKDAVGRKLVVLSGNSRDTSFALTEQMVVRLQLATAQQELDTARTAAERSANEFQQRLAELTQENARLVGEVHGANEALESSRAQSHERSTQERAALTALRLQLTAA